MWFSDIDIRYTFCICNSEYGEASYVFLYKIFIDCYTSYKEWVYIICYNSYFAFWLFTMFGKGICLANEDFS